MSYLSDITYLSDYSSKAGAERLIQHIQSYWRERGLPAPEFSISRARKARYDSERHPIYAVESDMINGLPRQEYERRARNPVVGAGEN